MAGHRERRHLPAGPRAPREEAPGPSPLCVPSRSSSNRSCLFSGCTTEARADGQRDQVGDNRPSKSGEKVEDEGANRQPLALGASLCVVGESSLDLVFSSSFSKSLYVVSSQLGILFLLLTVGRGSARTHSYELNMYIYDSLA